MNNLPKKARSKEYPAVSLRKAVDLARRIYEKDRWAESLAETAVKHMGYAGLNGGSRPVLSALKKYGLLEYVGSGENLRVKLTDRAKRVMLPVDDSERSGAVWEALCAPSIHLEILAAFPDWDLPSDETLAARLERGFGLQHAAVKPFIADLRDSLDFARGLIPSNDKRDADEFDSPLETASNMPPPMSKAKQPESGPRMMKLPMSGSDTYIVFLESMTPEEGRRVLSWLKRVVTPAVEFASSPEDEYEEA